MDEKLIQQLFSTLNDVVRAEGTWTSKRDKILEEASPDDKTNLEEFLAWFPEDSEE